ncbi:unnamed protein product, partial [Ectocarpus sp. 8 AP-2014]
TSRGRSLLACFLPAPFPSAPLCRVVKKTRNLPPSTTPPSTYKRRAEAPVISFGSRGLIGYRTTTLPRGARRRIIERGGIAIPQVTSRTETVRTPHVQKARAIGRGLTAARGCGGGLLCKRCVAA